MLVVLDLYLTFAFIAIIVTWFAMFILNREFALGVACEFAEMVFRFIINGLLTFDAYLRRDPVPEGSL